MKTTSILALALGAASTAYGQIPSLPNCASGPALSAIQSSGCGTDISCVCKNTAFLQGLQATITTACSPSDLQAAIAAASSLCASVGVSLPAAGGAASPPASSPAATVTYPASSGYTAPAATGTGGAGGSTNGSGVIPPSPSQSIITGGAPAVTAAHGSAALVVGIIAAVLAL